MKPLLRSLPRFLRGSLVTVFAVMTSLNAQSASGARPLPAGVVAHIDMPYVENGHERQVLDLYLPEQQDGPLPLIIWIHGGAWAAGSKEGCPPLRSGYVAQGYAVASINYRLSQHAIFPAQIQDCKAAIRWLRAHASEYGLDAKHFAVMGSSAGGHLVALLGTSGDVAAFDVGANLDQSSRVQAVGDYYGPTDFVQMDANAVPDTRLIHNDPKSPESRLVGGPIQDPAFAAQVQAANPVNYVSKDDPPFVIIHGDEDPAVPHHQSELLYAQLVATGVPVHFITVHGGGHGKGFPNKELEPIVSAFLDRNLRGNMSAANWSKTKTLTVQATEDEVPAAPRANRPQASAPTPAPAETTRRGPPTWDVIKSRSDRNHDGKVAADEFDGPAGLFKRLDTNGDGYLTEEEHNAFSNRERRN